MHTTTRRRFMGTAAAAAGGLAAPWIVPSSVLGRDGRAAPSERVTVGIIGSGIMGDRHRRNFSVMPQSQVVAVCDVNPDIRRRIAQETPDVRLYTDFRELLDRGDIDAVVISTPHHSHAWITVAAARAGKDIYCEKPLTHTNRESRVVVDTVRRYGRILEVGTHRRAGVAQRFGCELVRNQRIGALRKILVLGRPGLTTVPAPVTPALPVPDGFDWDLWLGPAPWTDFCGVHERRRWNRYWDYSTGEITMTDCHIVDVALWGAKPFLKGPIEIDGAMDPEPTVEYRVTFRYASGVTMVCEGRSEEPQSKGVKFEGSEGSVFIDALRYHFWTEPANLQHTVIGPDEVHLPDVKRLPNEWRGVSEDFLHAVRTREEPICPVEGGHDMTVISNLIWIAAHLRRKLTWDDREERFVGDDDANRLLHYSYRSPCTL
jgi:predicted dehydrogenase